MNNKATKRDYQKLLDILKLSLERMNNINNNLLILSEGTPSKSGWSRVEMVSLITEMVNEAKTVASVANINIEWAPPASEIAIYGDDMHIKQALFNLIDNAIKYNHSGGSIRLSVRTEDKTAIIEVADTGIGITAEDLPRIFDRFFRVDKSRSRDRGGSGLGLAIVKKIIEAHDGTISADSAPGHGSTFRISLLRYQSI
jgi:signal transduction histidine kinase